MLHEAVGYATVMFGARGDAGADTHFVIARSQFMAVAQLWKLPRKLACQLVVLPTLAAYHLSTVMKQTNASPQQSDITKRPRVRRAIEPEAGTEAEQPAQPNPPQAPVDLEHYVPAYLGWISNKLSRGASQHYLRLFDVGIEVWRCLVLLAVDGSITAQQVSRVVGMDKASVSRCFKQMQSRELITMRLDAHDGRLRVACLTQKGRELHDQILSIALERERALLSVLSQEEQEALLGFLRRLHDNLPAVEEATKRHIERHFPEAGMRRNADPPAQEDSD